MSQHPDPEAEEPDRLAPQVVNYRSINWLLDRPRKVRILIAAFFAFFVTLAIFPVFDALYLNFAFTMETRVVPALVTAGIGMASYMVGWYLIVGTVGERPEARLAILWYCGIGLLAIFVVILLFVNGLIIINMPT